jgi:small-conductance mechanosensitive channel
MQWLIDGITGLPSSSFERLRGILVGAALLILAAIVAWLLGWLARVIFIALFRGRIEALSRLLGYKQLEQSLRFPITLATLVGYAVQLVVSVVALLVLADFYAPASTSALVVQGVGYVPAILVALIILIVGLFLSQVFADLTFTAARADKRTDATVLSMAVRIGVVVLAVCASLLELGIATIFITAVLVCALAGTALALGLATGLGGADYVRDLLAGRTVRTQLKPGQRIQIDDVSGIVIECGRSSTLIATDDGKRTLLPNKIMTERTIVLG